MNSDVSRNPQENKGKLNFKCSDVGPKNCDWQVSGNSEQEIMPKIEQHGREKHSMTIDEETRNKVRSSIRRQAA
jgi:predicted small metal-binding protein